MVLKSISVIHVSVLLMIFVCGGDFRLRMFVECTSGYMSMNEDSFGLWRFSSSSTNFGFAVALTAMALIATFAYSQRGGLKSSWSFRRNPALLPNDWKSLFGPDGRLSDGGIHFLKKVRTGGIDPSIRAEVWPFLLGVYEVYSSKEDRDSIKSQKRKEFESLRRKCRDFRNHLDRNFKSPKYSGINEALEDSSEVIDPHGSENTVNSALEMHDLFGSDDTEASSILTCRTPEDFTTWRRIIRLDAVRANSEWTIYSPSQANVSVKTALNLAERVGLTDFDHLEPSRIFHASRLVSILEAYAIHDPEIGYCQGMSDLLSPIVSVIENDVEAFWCFVGFMKKARHNFRLDEIGIRRQLNIVSKIIRLKDSDLYKHLEKLQAEDCFFVYRMVVVLFRRELSFEQTLWLWEVMWADQASVRAGIGESVWGRIRVVKAAPPTDNLLLYAIAACVLRRRKLIIEKYSSMDEIMRECNGMAGCLDVWKLLDDAHRLVTMYGKNVENPNGY